MLGAQTQRYAQLIVAAQAGRVEPATLHKGADELDAQFGASGPSALSVLQPVLATRTSLADFALNTGLTGAVAESQAVNALSAWLRATARWAEFETAAGGSCRPDGRPRPAPSPPPWTAPATATTPG